MWSRSAADTWTTRAMSTRSCDRERPLPSWRLFDADGGFRPLARQSVWGITPHYRRVARAARGRVRGLFRRPSPLRASAAITMATEVDLEVPGGSRASLVEREHEQRQP